MTITINGTTGIAGVDGSASTPAIQGNDTNTGIYYPVANEVAASADGSAVWNASGTFGFKNRLINGDFNIWQRGTSFTGNFSNLYGADRWAQGQFQSGPQSRQSVTTAGVPFIYACRISSSSTASIPGGSRMALGQMVEFSNCYDLRSTPVTLSFWVRFSNSTFTSSTATAFGDFFFSIWQYTTTTDANFATTTPDIVTQVPITNGSLPTTWTKYSVTVTTSAQLSNIAARFNMNNLGSTASDGTLWYEVTGVQIEKGSVATSFDNISIGTELMLCQRYYQIWKSGWAGVSAGSGYQYSDGVNFCVPTRVAPTLALTSWTTGARFPQASWFTANVGVEGFLSVASANAAGGNDNWLATGTASAEL